jgi:hypothetical protein
MADDTGTTTRPYEITVLDDLIGDAYNSLTAEMKENPKLGDLLRMIELRRKLLPNEDDQKQFWAMLEQIRQKNLTKRETGDKAKASRRRKRSRKTKASDNV